MSEQSLLKKSLWRGFKCRCPNCGEGKLFKSFLKVVSECAVCREEFHHHRADDLPAYIVVFIMGHVFVTLALDIDMRYAPPMWVHAAIWLPSIVISSLLLLQPVKGLIVALQWHLGLHGFKKSHDLRHKK